MTTTNAIRMRTPASGLYTFTSAGRSCEVTITRGHGLKAVVTASSARPMPGGYRLANGSVLLVVDGGAGAIAVHDCASVIGDASRLVWPRRSGEGANRGGAR